MLQQVNFYLLLPKPPQYQLNASQTINITALFSAALLFIYLITLLNYFWQNHHWNQLQQAQQTIQQQLITLSNKYNNDDKKKPLAWRNQQLAAELNNKQNLLIQLKQANPSEFAGYSNYLLSFAKTIVPGVWLTEIEIEPNMQQIHLSGTATNSIAIMQFIENLRKVPIFKGKAFSMLHLENASENANLLNFTLSTARENNAQLSAKTP